MIYKDVHEYYTRGKKLGTPEKVLSRIKDKLPIWHEDMFGQKLIVFEARETGQFTFIDLMENIKRKELYEAIKKEKDNE